MSARGRRRLSLDDGLASLMAKLDRKNKGAWTAAQISSAWARVAGAKVSGHTTGVHLRDKTLVVYVDSHAWANDLAALSERYRTELNSDIGKDLVETVQFTVSRKVQEERQLENAEEEAEGSYSEDVVESIPLTDVELAQVTESVSRIEDEDLREAVYRATVKDLEWKKGLAARSSRDTAREGF